MRHIFIFLFLRVKLFPHRKIQSSLTSRSPMAIQAIIRDLRILSRWSSAAGCPRDKRASFSHLSVRSERRDRRETDRSTPFPTRLPIYTREKSAKIVRFATPARSILPRSRYTHSPADSVLPGRGACPALCLERIYPSLDPPPPRLENESRQLAHTRG